MATSVKIDFSHEQQNSIKNSHNKMTSPTITKKVITRKIKKKVVRKVKDLVDLVAKAKKHFETRDVGSFDWAIGTNMTNEMFVDKTFKERIDAQKLNMALMHYGVDYFGKLEYYDMYGKKNKIKITSDDEQYALKSYHQFYTKILDNLDVIELENDEKEYELDVSYSAKDKNSRVYPIGCMSLSQILRELRHFISDEIYYDFDLKCSAQRLLCGVFENYNLDYPMMYYYVCNRDEILRNVMKEYCIDRDTAKKLFTMETFGGDCLNYLQGIGCIPLNENHQIHEFLKDFHKEMTHNILVLYTTEELKEIKDIVDKKETDKKKRPRSFICKLYHMCEMECLKITYEVAIDMDIIEPVNPRCVLAHDGIMIEKRLFTKSGNSVEEFLEEVNRQLRESSGMKTLEMILKPQDEGKKMEQILAEKELIEYVDRFYNLYGITRKGVHSLDIDEKQMAELYLDQQKGVIMTTAKRDKEKIETGELYKREKGSGLWKIINDIQFKREYTEYMNMFIKYIEKLIKNEWRTNINVKANYRKGVMALSDRWNEMYKDNEKMLKQNPFGAYDENFNLLVDGVEEKQKTKLEKLREYTRKEAKLNSICSAVKTQTCDNDFYDKLDKDPYLLGFNNGVLDLKNGIVFRNCRSDEYVRKSVGYDFIDIDNCDEKTREIILGFQQELEEDLRNNYETDSEYEWVMQNYSRSLMGAEISNKEQKITIKIGRGSNGKGFEESCNKEGLGEYAYTLNPESFKHGLKMNDPNIFGLYQTRMGFISEPDGRWNATLFKNICSDKIKVRTLFMESGKDIKCPPIVVSTNEPIAFSSVCKDDSIPRRTLNIEMTTSYKDEKDYDPTNSHHKLKKQEYEWCDLRRMAYMRILMKYLQIYRDNGSNLVNNIPMRFKINTEEYLGEINIEEKWVKEHITHKEKKNLLAYDYTTKDGQKFYGVISHILNHGELGKRFQNKTQVIGVIEKAVGKTVSKNGGYKCYDIHDKLVSDLDDKPIKQRCIQNAMFGCEEELVEEEEDI